MTARTAAPIRNVAIIAHVDHGKTTLVDKMILQAGLFRENQVVQECMLDSNDLERERGITILAKNIAIRYRGVKINVIDTPGHADFGGEVERVLRLADGAILLVDAFEGPMPQTRFVLRKALEAGLRPILIVNKMDRPDSRGRLVVDEVFDLMVDLGADDRQLDFPVLFASGRQGWVKHHPEDEERDMVPLLDTILETVPAPVDDAEGPLQMQVANLDWNPYTGRTAVGRVYRGVLRPGQPVALVKDGGRTVTVQAKRVLVFEGMGKEVATQVRAGDICAVEGIEEVEIGDTLCVPERIEPLPRITVDAPTISMTFQVNDGPFAGQEGRFVTSRNIRERLYREVLRNVALRVEDTDRPEVLKVSGRGVLHLGILIEEMRREGYEFCVGKPKVIFKDVAGERCEPIEMVQVEAPEAHAGKVIEILGQRRGEMVRMEPKEGHMEIEFRVPSRGLIGIRTRLMNVTQGEATLHHVFDGYEPDKGAPPGRAQGVMISSETGTVILYALGNLKDRGAFFVPPGAKVYEGMVVGEHCKDNDIEVNVCREKKLTNIRTTSADKKIFIPPHRAMGVEDAIEYIDDDELVEITPSSVRLRKIHLKESDRRRLRRQPAAARD